jgi:hypothetical protein
MKTPTRILIVMLLAAAGLFAQNTCVRGTFPSYNTDPDSGEPTQRWDGPRFNLSQDYPGKLPPMERYPWLKIPIVNGRPADPRAYIMAIKQYVLEGNTQTDHIFDFQANQVRKWYHIPWMHYGHVGREFVHGLTHEIDSSPFYLDKQSQTGFAATWSVSGINDRGAWGVGNVWCDPKNPTIGELNPDNEGPNSFPDGTAQAKILFTSATQQQVKWLAGTLQFTAFISNFANPKLNQCHADSDCGSSGFCNLGVCSTKKRSLQPVYLMQMDVAVRDSRLLQTGWVFGTFAYNAQAKGSTVWEKLIPIGLMWGNDPGVTPAKAAAGNKIQESWINPDAQPLNDQGIFHGGNHLGYAGRLNGPADNAESSCLSCHATAGLTMTRTPRGTRADAPPLVTAAAPKPPAMTTERKLAWFLNLPAGVPFSWDTQFSLDYQLQMAIGIQRFYEAQCNNQVMPVRPIERGTEMSAKP